MKLVKQTLLFLSIITLLFSCGGGSDSDDPTPTPTDSEQPTISLSSPSGGSAYSVGSDIEFTCTFADDIELASYSVEISFKEELPATSVIKTVPSYNEWSYELSNQAITGVSEAVSKTISIPATITDTESEEDTQPGIYEFEVSVLDGAGKTNSTTVEITIN